MGIDGREGKEGGGGGGDDVGTRRGLQTDPKGLNVGLNSSRQTDD